MKSTQSNRPNDKSVKMLSTRKTNQQPATSTEARSHISSMSRLPTVRQARHLVLLFFSCWLGVYIHGQCDIRVHGLRSLDHWLWFHPPIVSLRVSQSPWHRWWSCWQAQRTSVSKRWIHRVHDQLTRTGKRTYGLYTRSLRLDGTTWGGTPHVSKVASPVITQGSNCANWL